MLFEFHGIQKRFWHTLWVIITIINRSYFKLGRTFATLHRVVCGKVRRVLLGKRYNTHGHDGDFGV